MNDTPCDVCTTPKDEFIMPKEPRPGARILSCTCPFCKNKVGAEIMEGYITCPACGVRVEWKD